MWCIDLDALAKAEKENWVWRGAQILKPDYKRCLVALSRGGADATVTREFDLETRAFVAGRLLSARSQGQASSWIDADHAYVCDRLRPRLADHSGYPRIAKLWKRGTPLSEAEDRLRGPADRRVRDRRRLMTRRASSVTSSSRGIAFYKSETFLRKPDGSLAKIEVPDDANARASTASG